ncbi:hypothetical protein OA79_07860 [Marinomonas sp. TW1]|nr:hypothetical protein OA79_07860 [Marinomonas sp. TW1]
MLDTFLNVRKDLSDFLVTFVALDKSYPPSRAEKSSPTKANEKHMNKPQAKIKKLPQPKPTRGNEQNTGQREKLTEYRAKNKAANINAQKSTKIRKTNESDLRIE